jgi:hypothetical protein
LISDLEVERALDYLRDNATADAQARADALYLEQWVKTERARLTTEQAGMSNAAAVAVAESHPEYLRALSAYKAAVTEDYRRRFLREAAAARIEAYRTQEASRRAEGRMFGNG